MVSRIAQELNYVALILYFQWHYWTRMSQKKIVCKKWKGLWSEMASIGSFQNWVWRTKQYCILAFCFLIHVFYHGYHGYRDFFLYSVMILLYEVQDSCLRVHLCVFSILRDRMNTSVCQKDQTKPCCIIKNKYQMRSTLWFWAICGI